MDQANFWSRVEYRNLVKASAPTATIREIFCREGCSGNIKAGLRAAFVFLVLESKAIAAHFQDVDVVRELVQ